jgi:hypothetical protein
VSIVVLSRVSPHFMSLYKCVGLQQVNELVICCCRICWRCCFYPLLSRCVQLVDSQQLVHDLRLQLGTLQGNHRETSDQLSEKSKQVVTLKTELDRLSNQGSSMAEEVC